MGTKDGILLASGGMDSTTLAYWLIHNDIDFIPVFINYGQHCANTEYDTLLKVVPPEYKDKIEVIDVSSVYKHSKSRFIIPANLWEDKISADDLYIPYRNVLLLTIGASIAQTFGFKNVYSAFINSNHAKEIDCSSLFFDKLETLLTEFGSIKINMPFRNFSKYQVAKLGIDLHAPIATTFSCQASSIIPCGACPNCVDRLNAMRQIELESYLETEL